MATGDEGLVDLVGDGVKNRKEKRADPICDFPSLIGCSIRQPIEDRVLGDVRALLQQKIPPRLGRRC